MSDNIFDHYYMIDFSVKVQGMLKTVAGTPYPISNEEVMKFRTFIVSREKPNEKHAVLRQIAREQIAIRYESASVLGISIDQIIEMTKEQYEEVITKGGE